MTTSRLQKGVAQYRAQLAHHEAKAEAVLNTAHKHTVAAIQPHLDQLYRAIAEKQASGSPVPVSALYETFRLQKTKDLIIGQMNSFGSLAKDTTMVTQSVGAHLGQEAAQALLKATVPIGINFSFGVPSLKAIESLVGATQKGSPLADLFAGFGAEAADKVATALITGLTLGENPRRIASLVEDALNISRARALTISRTEMLRSYRSANLLNYQQNSSVVDKWVWSADLSPRSCAACIAMNGTIHDLDEDMASHVNCRCSPVPLTRSWSDILSPLGIDASAIPDTRVDIPDGAEWFSNQDKRTQRSILGSDAAYKLYSSGVPLKSFVGVKHDNDWGYSIYVKSIGQMKKGH